MGDLVATGVAFNSGGDLRRPNRATSSSAHGGGAFLISFTIAPFDQSLVTTCSEGRGEEVPTPIASVIVDVGLEETFWVRLAYLKFRKEEEGAVLLFGPVFGGGDGTVMAGTLFAAAAEVSTEDFFSTRFLGAFLVGIVSLLSFLDGAFLGAFLVGIVSLVSFLDGTVLLV